MKNSVKRWVYIINVLRAIPYTDYDDLTMEVEITRLTFHTNNDNSLDVIDALTGEVHITFDEDGSPIYLSDWAQAPVQWEQYDYPMYAHYYDTWDVPYPEQMRTIAWSIGPGQKVAIVHDGRDYVIDTTGEYIEVFNSDGKMVMKLGYNEEYIYE